MFPGAGKHATFGFHLLADEVFSGALFSGICPGEFASGARMAFLLALLLKGLAPTKAQVLPHMVLSAIQGLLPSSQELMLPPECASRRWRHQLLRLSEPQLTLARHHQCHLLGPNAILVLGCHPALPQLLVPSPHSTDVTEEALYPHHTQLLCLDFLMAAPWHIEVPRLRVESELQSLAYTQDPSHICDLTCSLWQCLTLNPLWEARD